MTQTGIVNFADREQKRQFLVRAGALNKAYEVSFKLWRPKRSNRANSWYWAAVIPALRAYMSEQGEEVSADDAHTILKTRCLGVREIVSRATGEVIQIPKSTTALNVQEFSGFVERCLAFLGELGIVVPDMQNFTDSRSKEHASA